jgi:hypothetical protein
MPRTRPNTHMLRIPARRMPTRRPRTLDRRSITPTLPNLPTIRRPPIQRRTTQTPHPPYNTHPRLLGHSRRKNGPAAPVLGIGGVGGVGHRLLRRRRVAVLAEAMAYALGLLSVAGELCEDIGCGVVGACSAGL